MADKYTAYELLGKAGCILIDDTGQHTGPFKAVAAMSGTVNVDVSDCTFGASMIEFDADFDMTNGFTLLGDIEVFSLNTGKVVAYYA